MSSRMLIVDDETSILFAVSDYFGARGFEVDCASELVQAESLLEQKQYDVVIADLRLTGIDGTEGLELISYVREKSATTKVILLTAYGTAEIEEQARLRNVDAFLQKPQALSAIANVVEEILKPQSTSEVLA